MMPKSLLLAFVLASFSCTKKKNKELINLMDVQCKEYFFGVKEMNQVESDAFKIKYPKNWIYSIESDSIHTTYVFTEKIDTTNDFEITDEEFNRKYANFQTISITYDALYSTMNYATEFENVKHLISNNKDQQIIQTGVSMYNGQQAGWIKFKDDSYISDKLVCESLTTCMLGTKHYIWILIQTFGEHNKELRQCEGMEILRTLELKV